MGEEGEQIGEEQVTTEIEQETPDFTRLYELETSVEETNERAEDDASLVKQMTPPKSVESVVNAQPLSNNSLFTKTILTNSNSMMPPSYDDLNNIFEEDSADDEQIIKPDASNPSTSLTMANTMVSNATTSSTTNQAPTLMAFTTGASSSKSACLSVVMTPPSHENMALPAISAHEESSSLLPLVSSTMPNQVHYQHTRAIKLNDYTAIMSDKKRVDFSVLLLKDLTSESLSSASSSTVPNKFEKLKKVSLHIFYYFI